VVAETEFCILGPLLVRRGGTVVAVPPGKQRVLLAALLLGANRIVRVEELAGALWGSDSPPSARASLQTYVMRLRKLLADVGLSPISTEAEGYLFSVGPGELDVDRFESMIAAGREAARAGSWAVAAVQFRAALSLWHGEPLSGVRSEALVSREIPRLAEMRLQALEARIDADLHLGRHGDVIVELRQLTGGHPLRERLHRLLMLALYRDGQQAGALAAYRAARSVLVDELGVEPGPELRQLQQQILVGEPSSAWPGPRSAAAGSPGLAAPPGRQQNLIGPRQLDENIRAASGPAVALSLTRAASGKPASAPRLTVPRRQGLPRSAGQQIRPRSVVPRQLPSRVLHFIGRSAELASLDRQLRQTDQASGTVLIAAISGTAGVGKTALAVHWAHQVAGRFPDGQLYINLHGHGPSRNPVAPAEAISSFLDALQVPAEQIPARRDARAGLYRSLMAEKRMLLVLDNARNSDQIRSLVPSGAPSLVIVTSREPLTGLVAVEDAHPVSLDVLSAADARELLVQRLGRERTTAEPDVLSDITELCARLPLALAVAAARIATRPGLPLATLVAELRATRGRLDALDAGEPTSSVRAVLSWSYRHLPNQAARQFRLLGVHPGPDITAAAAASMAGVRLDQALRTLNELTRVNMLAEHTAGRFAFHDVLRSYAAELADAKDCEPEQRPAIHRMLDHYLHSADLASRVLCPLGDMINVAPPEPGVTTEQLVDEQRAMHWFEAEHRVLPAVIGMAVSAGFDRHAWQVAATLTTFRDRRGSWQGSIAASLQTGLAAAQRTADWEGQAVIHRSLGYSRAQLGSYQQARAHYERAVDFYRELGDLAGQGRAYNGLGAAFEQQGQYREGLEFFVQALGLYQAAGDRSWQAVVLNNIGWCHSQLGNYEQGLACCEQALAVHQELGNQSGEAHAWDSLGYAHRNLVRFGEAVACHQQALTLFRKQGDRFHQAEILIHLGDTYEASGEVPTARAVWQEALAILDDLRHPTASQVRARL
jgi:DNA-binding SARP family transcriptional activator/Tfp pilus assembly protein PilF